MKKSKKDYIKSIFSLIGFPLLFVSIFLLVYLFRKDIVFIFKNPEQMKEWVSARGVAAPLVFIALQIAQVVIFILPGEIAQFAGGYLFGVGFGILYSIIGIAIGGSVNFFLARWLGVPFVHLLFKEEKIKRLEMMAKSKRSQLIVFLIFLIPGIPKDMVSYVVGLTSMPFLTYLLVSTLGRMPGIIGSAIMGDATAERNWPLTISIFVIATSLFLIGYFFKDKILKIVDQKTQKIEK